MDRRQLGTIGLGALAALAVGAPGVWWVAIDEDVVILALCDALFPPGGGLPEAAAIGVPAKVRAYLAAMPERTAFEARGALRLVETMTLPTHGAPFSSLPREAREAVLIGLAGSSLMPERLLANAVKQLCAMGYWQSPETWGHLGYDGPWVGR